MYSQRVLLLLVLLEIHAAAAAYTLIKMVTDQIMGGPRQRIQAQRLQRLRDCASSYL